MEQNLLLKQCADLAQSLKYERSIKITSYVGRIDRPDKIVVAVEVRNSHFQGSPFHPFTRPLETACEGQGPDLSAALIDLKNNLINSVKYRIDSSLRENSELVKVLAKAGIEPDVKE